MNTLLQPGHHPDADQLSAFAEHALPAHEQQQTLAHLAICPDCRALLYLTQQAAPIEAQKPHSVPNAPWFSRWFSGWTLAIPATAALACLIFLTIHLRNTPNHPTPTTTASLEPTQPTPPAAQPALPSTQLSSPASSAQPSRPPRSSFASPPPHPPTQKKPQSIAHTETLAQASEDATIQTAAAPAPRAAPPLPPPLAQSSIHGALALRSQTAGDATITGQITDQTGASIPRAKITATNTHTGVQLTRESTVTGSFSLAPLQPGTYTVEAAAPGFQRLLQQNVSVAPLQIAALNLKLPIGAASETVTVTNGPPFLSTSNATLDGTIENELYTNLPLTAEGAPRSPAAFQYLTPGVQTGPPQQQTAATAAPQQQGVYGGTGQTNLNQNYVDGVPATISTAQPSNPSAASTVITGAALDALSDDSAFSAGSLAVLAQPKPLTILPSKLPARSIVTNARQALALDIAGALYRSADAGLTWHPIPSQWKGRALTLRLIAPAAPATGQAAAQNAARISEAKAQTQTPAAQTQATQTAAPPAAQPATFELTTDNGTIWTSPDGQTWHLK